MAEATFWHGNPHYVDHTPGSAVAAGQVIVAGDSVYVAHVDIAANEKAAVAAFGGSYKVTADGALSGGVQVYWDNGAKKVTATAAGNERFGFVHPDSSSAADGDMIYVTHDPHPGS